MKKSIPVSDDLRSYFTDPCPVLSDNNSEMILKETSKGYDFIVEYGMGASTLYFLPEAQKHKSQFISVENNFNWFEICIQEIKKQTAFKEISHTNRQWSWNEIKDFIKKPTQTDIPDIFKRHSNWADKLSTGPFFRFSPKAHSRFSGKLGPLWPILKPIFSLTNKMLYAVRPDNLLQNGEWKGQHKECTLILRNVAPCIKDQFGEATNMMEYIGAGLKDIQKELEEQKNVSALFVIDGGPRHKIVQEILNLEEQYEGFQPTIILCDASRVFYHDTLNKRSSGKFIAGTNKTLKGDPVETGMSGPNAQFWAGGNKTGDELSKQEVWYYSRTA